MASGVYTSPRPHRHRGYGLYDEDDLRGSIVSPLSEPRRFEPSGWTGLADSQDSRKGYGFASTAEVENTASPITSAAARKTSKSPTPSPQKVEDMVNFGKGDHHESLLEGKQDTLASILESLAIRDAELVATEAAERRVTLQQWHRKTAEEFADSAGGPVITPTISDPADQAIAASAYEKAYARIKEHEIKSQKRRLGLLQRTGQIEADIQRRRQLQQVAMARDNFVAEYEGKIKGVLAKKRAEYEGNLNKSFTNMVEVLKKQFTEQKELEPVKDKIADIVDATSATLQRDFLDPMQESLRKDKQKEVGIVSKYLAEAAGVLNSEGANVQSGALQAAIEGAEAAKNGLRELKKELQAHYSSVQTKMSEAIEKSHPLITAELQKQLEATTGAKKEAAAKLPDSTKADTKTAESSAGTAAAPDSVSVSTETWKSPASEYKELEAILLPVQAKMRAFLADKSKGKDRLAAKKVINKAVNQIADKQSFVLEKVNIFVQTIQNAAQMSDDFKAYVMDLMSSSLVRQGEAQVSKAQNSAYPIAAVMAGVAEKVPEMIPLYRAHFVKRCPFCLPIIHSSADFPSKNAWRQAMGFDDREPDPDDPGPKEVELEKNGPYTIRMSGYIALYAALLQNEYYDQEKKLLPMSLTWTWFARILNAEPHPINVFMMVIFLEVAGHQMSQCYGRQMKKLMALLRDEYLTKRMHKETEDAHVARLKALLKDYFSKGTFGDPKARLLAP
eukprot:Clim_evm3s26 gene=Clim_evmTU3s26